MIEVNKKQLVWTLMPLFFLFMAATDMFLAALPTMTHHFMVTATVSSLMISAYTFGLAPFSLISGVISERIGRKPCIVYGALIFVVTSALIPFMPNIWIIIALRFIQALGAAFILIVARLVIKDCMTDKEQINTSSLMAIGMIISPAISPIVGAFLFRFFGWQSIFYTLTIFSFILFLFTLKLPETLPKENRIKRLPGAKEYFGNYVKFFEKKLFFPLLLMVGAPFAAYWGFIGISSFLFMSTLHVQPIVFSCIYATTAFSTLLGNYYNRKWNSTGATKFYLIFFGIVISVIGTLILFFASIPLGTLYIVIVLTVGLLIMRSAFSFIFPSTQVILMNIYGREGGQALGFLNFFQFLLGSLGIVMVSFFHTNPLLGLQVVSVFFTIVLILAWLGLKKCGYSTKSDFQFVAGMEMHTME